MPGYLIPSSSKKYLQSNIFNISWNFAVKRKEEFHFKIVNINRFGRKTEVKTVIKHKKTTFQQGPVL